MCPLWFPSILPAGRCRALLRPGHCRPPDLAACQVLREVQLSLHVLPLPALAQVCAVGLIQVARQDNLSRCQPQSVLVIGKRRAGPTRTPQTRSISLVCRPMPLSLSPDQRSGRHPPRLSGQTDARALLPNWARPFRFQPTALLLFERPHLRWKQMNVQSVARCQLRRGTILDRTQAQRHTQRLSRLSNRTAHTEHFTQEKAARRACLRLLWLSP